MKKIVIAMVFGTILYWDPTSTWIEISKVFYPGEGMESSFTPWPHVIISGEIAFLFFLNCILTMLLGFMLTAGLWRRTNSSLMVKLFASFIPGYLASCAIVRIVTFFLSHKYAPGLILFFQFLLIIFFLKIHKPAFGPIKKSQNNKNLFYQIIFAIILFSLCFTEGIQWGYHFLTGDGTGFFLKYLDSVLPTLDFQSSLPIVDQHADELLYNYPILYTFNNIQNPQVLFWFLNVVGRFSMIYLFYLLFRYYRLNRTHSIIATLFFFCGTTAINPTKYLLLFDGVNPLFYVLNIHRSISASIPFLWFALLEGTRKGARYPLILLTVGILMTSIHNSMAILITSLLWFICPSLNQNPLSIEKYKHSHLFFVLLIMAPIVTYSFISTTLIGFHGVLLFAACLLCLWPTFQLVNWKHFKSNYTQRISTVLCVYAAFFIASLTLGNVITVLFRKLMVSLHFENLFRFEPILSRAMIEMNHPLYLFHFVGCEGPTSHCKSGIAFVGYYGMYLLLSYLAFSTVLKTALTKKTRLTHHLMFQLFLSLGLFIGALLIKDFFDKNTMAQGWLFTRLLEIPYYSILFIFFIVSGRYWAPIHRRQIQIMSVLWSLIPFISTHRVDQWISNLKFLFKSNFFH